MSNTTVGVTLAANMDVSQVLGAINSLKGGFNGLSMPKNLTSDMEKSFEKLTQLTKQFQQQLDKGISTKSDAKALAKTGAEIDKVFSNLKQQISDANAKEIMLKADVSKLNELESKLANLKSKLNESFTLKLQDSGTISLLDRFYAATNRAKTAQSMVGKAQTALLDRRDIETYTAELDKLQAKIRTFKESTQKGMAAVITGQDVSTFQTGAQAITAIDEAIKKLKADGEGAKSAVKGMETDLAAAAKETSNFRTDALERGKQNMEGLGAAADHTAGQMRNLAQAENESANAMLSMKDQVGQLQQSTQYFFGLRNIINLLKRGVREAVNTIKELDAAMTQTAVVTNFSVGDMWGKLPEYTANANALGASVKDMYESATLYYQQGLQGAEVMNIASETMKMARIGGLEAADATDKMTAALRGFNMELNEASAQRVNDVYSNLAAKTASDTEELGTAMQRTASIAASAGMSFEGTAAFLAQAIETTREPAENLGTAMKTIVARFQELKKNPLEISDVEGEEVDYNKVDAALKTIGVDLKDTNGQFRDLDQVFLDISQRWNSLTQTQQRYIATTAAGSRQQSRFIAMMSNYDRTMELMSYANDSSGASNEQFGKTLDSLEAKLNKFQNAWKEFLMGIMNDSWTKGIVSGATKVLNVINSLIDTLSIGGKAKGIKSFLSLFTAFTALKMTGRMANRMIGGLGGLIDPTSSFRQGFRGAAYRQTNPITQARAISQPIVGVLQRISSQIAAIATKQGIKQPSTSNSNEIRETTKAAYAQARADLNKLSQQKSFTMGEASKIFGGLDEKHQHSLFMNNPGTRMAMKQASFQWIDSKKMSPELTKQGRQYINAIYQGIEKGQISVDKGMKLIGRPDLWGEHFATDTAKAFSKQFQADSEKAGRAAQIGAWRQLGMKGASDEAKKAFLADQKNIEQYNKLVAENYNKAMQGLSGHQAFKGAVSNMGRFANDVGAVGDKFTQAGYGISAFGSLLAQLGGPIGIVGTGLQSLGGIVSSLGMSVSGMTSLFSLFTVGLTDATGAVVVAGSTIASIAAPIAIMGGAILLIHKYFKRVREAGEEVTKTFTEQNKKAEDNISKLKSYQGELAQLSKGVDANGNNINLDDSQYQRYLEIVDEIAAINPQIVDGYNAQGHAIINNNTALAETLKLQEQIRDEALEQYLDPKTGLQKLINARNVTSGYVKNKQNPASTKAEDAGLINSQKTPFASDVRKIADLLSLESGIKNFDFNKYGIKSLDDLKTGEEQAVKNFVKHREQIETDLSNSGIKLNKSILNSFDTLGENKQAFDEAIQPVYDNLLTQVSQSPLYDSIADEFKGALQTGLKDLAGQNLSASEMSKAANNMTARFANLTTGSGKYADALKIVEDAQSKFADTLDETEYKTDVQPAIDDLIKLKEEALDEGTAYGDALAEYLENQIQRISNFTKEGGANLSEALNTATDEIAAAESALDNFNEATKKDYSTASEGMKSIYDKTTETFKDSYGAEIQKHAEGMGDATFWTGAENLLSTKAIDKITSNAEDGYDAAAKVSKALKDLEPMLRDGQEGFDAFTQRVLDHSDALDKLADAGVTYDKETGLLTDIPDDQWHNVAEALGISDDLLAAMISKGRQFADISFMNIEEARKSLAASEFTIKGTSAKAGEQQKLYVKEDTLRAELANAGYVRREQQDNQIEVLKKQNVDILKSAESYEKGSKELADKFNDMGVKTLPDLIQTLNDTGDFTKDEIQAYADKLGLLVNEDRFNSLYSDIIEAAENPELAKQTGILETISAQVSILANNKTISEAEQDRKELNKELYGETGGVIDSAADYFAHGQIKDENGNIRNLTAGEYEQAKKSFIAVGEEYQRRAEEARINASQATGEEKKRWEALAKGYEQDYENIQKYLDLAAKAFEEKQEEADKAAKEKESRNSGREQELEIAKRVEREKASKGSAEDWYKKYGFGNTDINNRQQLNWGAEPYKQGKNWDNAQTWGLTEDDLRNQVSTFLSSGMTFGEGENAIALTFTPMLQGEDGTPQVLSSDTVGKYFDTIVAQATDANGKVDIEKLFELDKQGLEVEGQEINNLLMGAFTGEGKDEAANALGELEHQLEANKTKAQQLAQAVEQAATKGFSKPEQTTQPKESSTPPTPETKTVNTEETITKTVVTDAQETPNYTRISQDWGKFKQNPVMDLILNATANAGNTPELQQTIDATYNRVVNPVQINTEADTSGIDTVNRALGVLPSKKAISITASDNTGGIIAAVRNKLAALKAAFSLGGGAKGTSNAVTHTMMPSFGSAARGRYGTVGPNNKGGLTLTGEKGFEIAWIPSENRSMILGAGGPQMLSLPSDTVIYPHEQSKKILKRKSIPAGSHAEVHAGGYQRKYSATSVSGGVSASNSTAKTVQKTSKAVQKSAEDAGKAVGKVSVWWENIARKTEVSQRNMDKNQKAFENYIKEMRATLKTTGQSLKSGGGGGDDYIKNIGQYIGYYQAQLNKANKELKALNTGKGGTQKQMKANYGGDGYENIAQISYKKGKKSKEEYVNLASYIKAENGTYVVDQKALNKEKNVEKRKAIADAANKEINDRLSKKYKAEDEIEKANEALKKMGEELYETFFKWENELTKIWNITQKIEQAQSRMSRNDAYNDLLKSQLSTGKLKAGSNSMQKDLTNFKNKLQTQNQLLQGRQEAITESRKELQRILTSDDEKKTLQNVKAKLANKKISATQRAGYEQYQKELENQIAAQDLARKYTSIKKRGDGTLDIQFNAQGFEDERTNGGITSDIAKAVQDLQENYENLTKDVAEYYGQLESLQDEWADYGKELTEITEDAEKQKIDKVKQLYDGVKKALDKLLDEVKRKLDERRKQEENAKTERDISKKQQRLAMLRADTSGGHQVEIAQLEQEIAEAQQNYQNSLEDQLIDKLQQQADLAAEQRERQIEIQEALATSVNNIEKVNEWMADPASHEDEIRKAYYAKNNYNNVTNAEQKDIERKFNEFYNGLLTNQDKQEELNQSIVNIKDVVGKIDQYLVDQNQILATAKENGYTIKQAQEKFGASLSELRTEGKYNFKDFANAGYSNAQIKQAGFGISDFKANGITNAGTLKDAGFTTAQLKNAGYKLTKELYNKSTWDELKAAKFNIQDYVNIGVKDATSLRKAGFTLSQLKANSTAWNSNSWAAIKNAGYTITDYKNAGLTAANAKSSGFSLADIKKAGYSYDQVKNLGFTAQQLYNAGYTQAYPYGKVSDVESKIKPGNTGTKVKALQFALNQILGTNLSINGKYDAATKTAVAAFEKKLYGRKGDLIVGPQDKAGFKKYGYKTGGLASFTGPAWLDGTPSKPELVLDANDTKNFIMLKDVLSKAMDSSGGLSGFGGAAYEININVDHINSDYDVDKIAKRVKENIVKDSGYRNVTQVRKFR